jgi:predicted Fe-Mo cluster-binding NifX family protein
VAQFLADKGVGKLIAGEFGSRFVSELEEKGIDYAWMNGLVSDAIKALTG